VTWVCALHPDYATCSWLLSAIQMNMRTRIVVTALILLAVGGSIVVAAYWVRFPQYQASMQGRLLISGGPAPGTPRPSEGEVTATNAVGHSYRVTVPASGKFTLPLPAGTYSITGSSPQFGNGQYKCLAPREVTLSNGMSTHEDVFCSEK